MRSPEKHNSSLTLGKKKCISQNFKLFLSHVCIITHHYLRGDNKNHFRNVVDLSLCFPIKLQRLGYFPREKNIMRNSTFEGNVYGHATQGQGSKVTLSHERGHIRLFH